MTSPLSPGTGVRFVRTLSFDEHTGDFVIDEKAIKSIGALIDASIWSVAQITGGDWIVLPVNPRSAYKDGYANIQESLPPDAAKRVGDDLLYIAPSYKDHCKIGLDANSATIVTITGRTAFVQSASPPTEGAVYPDGIGGPGFPVELYIGDNQQQFYCELELLSPMTNAVAGKSWSQTIRWRVALLPAGSADSPEVAKAVRSLIY